MREPMSPNSANMDDKQAMTALKQHGGNIITVIAVVLAVYFGWQFWQKRPQTVDTEASDKFTEIQTLKQKIQLSEQNPELADAEKQTLQADKDSFNQQISDLTSNHNGSIYAWQGLMLQARQQMDAGKYKDASASLKQAEQTPSIDAGLVAMTKIRHAQALLAANEVDEAMSTISTEMPQSFEASKQELLGDIYQQKGDKDASIRSYQNAWDLLASRQEPRAVLALKMESLGMVVEQIDIPSVIEETKPSALDMSAAVAAMQEAMEKQAAQK